MGVIHDYLFGKKKNDDCKKVENGRHQHKEPRNRVQELSDLLLEEVKGNSINKTAVIKRLCEIKSWDHDGTKFREILYKLQQYPEYHNIRDEYEKEHPPTRTM